MRRIESEIARAIMTGKDYKNGKDAVRHVHDGSRIETTVILHDTVICRILWRHIGAESRACRIYSGGWRTMTTKSRINAVLSAIGSDVRIYQRKREWFVSAPGAAPVPFKEGIGF